MRAGNWRCCDGHGIERSVVFRGRLGRAPGGAALGVGHTCDRLVAEAVEVQVAMELELESEVEVEVEVVERFKNAIDDT
jgi:hypothetical protein